MALFEEGLIKAACADGDADAIRTLSGNIRVALRDRPGLGTAPCRTEGALGDSDAANFAYRMLRACSRVAIPPPSELVDLFQILFEQDRAPQKGVSVGLVSLAKEFLALNPNASLREIADHVNEGRVKDPVKETPKVAASTVSRWKKDGLLR
jgi:hypothetical protein